MKAIPLQPGQAEVGLTPHLQDQAEAVIQHLPAPVAEVPPLHQVEAEGIGKNAIKTQLL